MTLGLVTCLWGRPRLTKAFLEHWATLDVPGVDWVRVAVVSPEDETETQNMRHDSWHFTEYSNAYLSDKFNAGFAFLGLAFLGRFFTRMAVDAAIVVGSDDFATAGFVSSLVRKHHEGAHFIVPSGLYALCSETGQACFMDRPHIGTGRLLSRALLDKIDWMPYPSGQDYVNGNMCQRVAWMGAADKRSRGTKRHPAVPSSVFTRHHVQTKEAGILVDVKGPGSKNTYRRIARNAASSPVESSVITEEIPAVRAYMERTVIYT